MTDPAPLALLTLLLPAASFLILSVAYRFRRAGRPAAWFSVLCSGAALLSAFAAWRRVGPDDWSLRSWDWIPAEGGPLAAVGVLADADSLLMLILVAGIAFLVQLYSLGYLSDESPASLGRYYAYQSLFAFSMMGLVLAPNFVQLFIFWELVGLCSYLLIGYWYRKPEAARAAVKAFWTTKAGDVGLMIGIVLLWRQTGTFDFVTLLQQVDSGALDSVAGLGVITFCIYLGAVGKSAQFPLHVWLPDAMEGPTPVSALIHAATMVTAGVYLLVRTVWLFALTPGVLEVVGWVGAFTALLAATLACVQTDIKRVLAYSTVSQLGYMMAAIGAGFAGAGFLHLLTHGVFKALLFLAAGAVIHAVGSNDIFAMGGLARRMPQTFVVFVIGTLSLAGIPFLAGFVSKEAILGAVWTGGLTAPFGMLVLAAFLTAFYMFRVIFIAFLGSPVAAAAPGHGPGEGPQVHDAPPTMGIPLWILAAGSVVIGVGFAVQHPELEVEPEGWLTATAVAVALAGIGLAWLTYQRRTVDAGRLARTFGLVHDAAVHRFWLDDAFGMLYRQAILGSSRVVGWIDRYLVDGVVNFCSAWTLRAGSGLRRMQSGQPQDYLYGVAIGVLILMLLSRVGPLLSRWPR